MIDRNIISTIVNSITSLLPVGFALLIKSLLVLWFSITLVGCLIALISILKRVFGIHYD